MEVKKYIYCSNCLELNDITSKFCQNCGVPLEIEIKTWQTTESDKEEQNYQSTYSERKQEFVGKILKCPSCGEIMKSFVTNCPACNFELRGTKVTSAVHEFSLKLEAIEAQRGNFSGKIAGIFAQLGLGDRISKTDKQKISLIKNFSVPNTKEDILEFMILATSNMDTSVYSSTDTSTDSAKAIANAWESKIKQVYEKAKKSFGNDEDFQRVKQLYDNYMFDLKKQKKKKIIKWILLIAWIPMLWILLMTYLSISAPKKNATEETRLEAIVVDIETALESNDYKLALLNAESMEYNGHDKERERWWGIKKEALIDEIIKTAEGNGIHLERSPTITDEDDDSADSRGFVDGFKKGLQSGINDAKESFHETSQ